MTRSTEEMEKIKGLFKKLWDAHRWTLAHDAINHAEQYKAVVNAVEGWCDELEALNINRTFSMCIYTFGTDYRICYDMIQAHQKPTT